MTNVDLGTGNKESMEVASPNDQDTSRLIKNSEDNKNNCSGEQIDVTKSMEEVENQKKERTDNQIRITPIEEFYTQQAIKLQDVVLYNNIEGKTLETNVDSARINIQAGEVLANTRGVTITKCENGTNNEDCDYWKVRPPPKRKK
jgi:hypothetical protein